MKAFTRHEWLCSLAWILVFGALASAEVPVEELPRPNVAASDESQEMPATNIKPNVPPASWSLKGQRGQHFFFSDLAVADYTWGGRRHIALLDQDDFAQLKRVDPYFLYYHERESGNRWAIGRFPTMSQDYVVYFQPLDGAKVWIRFQQAYLHRDDERSPLPIEAVFVVESQPTTMILVEPTCGH